jgi:DNA replication and repair protein RecF
MHITHLSLTNFRNYARLEIAVPTGAVVLFGDNAQGKTSLLEAIYYLATSRSPYTTSDRQLINWMAQDEPLPFARLVAEVVTAEGLKRVEVTLVSEGNGRSANFKKEIRVDGLPRRVMDLLGQMRVVMFLPQDLSLVEGPPSGRRRYLNITLCQTSPDYCHALNQYEKVLAQRNALLRQMQEGAQRGKRHDSSQLEFWDGQLAVHAATLISGRFCLVRDLERRAQHVHSDLSGADEHLRLRYQPGFDAAPAPEGQLSFAASDLGAGALPELPPAEIAARFQLALRERRREEIARGMTLIGPQRDEMRFLVNGYDLGLYGSRGQGRTAVLALKLAELDWMQAQTSETPILLLDEVAAELDPNRRAYLLARIGGVEQAIVTSAEPGLLDDSFLANAARWHVAAGTIRTASADGQPGG